jgi:hypothetical protein
MKFDTPTETHLLCWKKLQKRGHIAISNKAAVAILKYQVTAWKREIMAQIELHLMHRLKYTCWVQ